MDVLRGVGVRGVTRGRLRGQGDHRVAQEMAGGLRLFDYIKDK